MKLNLNIKRSFNNRIIAGVLGGLAEYFAWNAGILRIIWVIFTLISGFFPGIIVYLIFWMIMPPENPNEPKDVTHTNKK